MSIAENIMQIRAEIAAAAQSVGRDPAEITLVGASKMTDAEACREAVAAGIDALGENRVQEMTAKLAEHAYDGWWIDGIYALTNHHLRTKKHQPRSVSCWCFFVRK